MLSHELDLDIGWLEKNKALTVLFCPNCPASQVLACAPRVLSVQHPSNVTNDMRSTLGVLFWV